MKKSISKLHQSGKSWYFWLVFNFAVIACAFLLAATGPWWTWIIALVVIGRQQHALAILGHDAIHRLFHKNRTYNDWIGSIFCFWHCLIGFDSFRNFHFSHHRNLGHEEDPERFTKSSKEFDLPKTRLEILVRSLLGLVGYNILQTLMFMKNLFPRTKRDIFGISMFVILHVALVYFGYGWMVALWFGAFFTSFWSFFKLRVWSEHIGTADTHRLQAGLLGRFFMPHNTWYHYEHHAYPQVPLDKYKELRQEMDDDRPVITVKECMDVFANRA